MYENPSAGRFGPPPGQERFEAPKPRRARQWSALLLAIVLYFARFELHHLHPTGWMTGVVLVAILTVGVGEYFVARRLRDRKDGGDPYTQPPTITR